MCGLRLLRRTTPCGSFETIRYYYESDVKNVASDVQHVYAIGEGEI